VAVAVGLDDRHHPAPLDPTSQHRDVAPYRVEVDDDLGAWT